MGGQEWPRKKEKGGARHGQHPVTRKHCNSTGPSPYSNSNSSLLVRISRLHELSPDQYLLI
jgi:hypothetical protein